MPFVKNKLEIDSWLSLSGKSFSLLCDAEYQNVLNKWRNAFDIYLEKNQYVYRGEKAMLAMEGVLPIEAFIFNFPGYRKLSAPAHRSERAYAYQVQSLFKVDRVVFNESDSIVCDLNFQYTCIYTHEWQGMAAPEYYQSKA